MPYSKNDDLPDGVKSALPAAAQTIRKNGPRPDVDTAEVVRLYAEEELPMDAVAEAVGLSRGGVQYRLKKAGVERRSCTAHSEGGDTWNYKGGTVNSSGYRVLSLRPDHPFYGMGTKRQKGNSRACLEHRVVMAEHLGRPLENHEVVHHLNGHKLDNRVENLVLYGNQAEHLSAEFLGREVRSLRKENRALKERIRDLEALMEEYENAV